MAESMDSADIKRYLLGRVSHRRNAWLREYLRNLALHYVEQEQEIKVLEPECNSDEERLELLLCKNAPAIGASRR